MLENGVRQYYSCSRWALNTELKGTSFSVEHDAKPLLAWKEAGARQAAGFRLQAWFPPCLQSLQNLWIFMGIALDGSAYQTSVFISLLMEVLEKSKEHFSPTSVRYLQLKIPS